MHISAQNGIWGILVIKTTQQEFNFLYCSLLVVYFIETFCCQLYFCLGYEGCLTSAPVALGGEGGYSCGEGVSCGRVHYTGVEGRVRVGPEGRETHSVKGCRENEKEKIRQQKSFRRSRRSGERAENTNRSCMLIIKAN